MLKTIIYISPPMQERRKAIKIHFHYSHSTTKMLKNKVSNVNKILHATQNSAHSSPTFCILQRQISVVDLAPIAGIHGLGKWLFPEELSSSV
jgi:hypothetical protein